MHLTLGAGTGQPGQPRQDRPIYAPAGGDEAPQEDAAVAAERRVLAALLQAGKRELP